MVFSEPDLILICTTGLREAAHRGVHVPLRDRAGLRHVSRDAAVRNAADGRGPYDLRDRRHRILRLSGKY